jgi:hypothetical protein
LKIFLIFLIFSSLLGTIWRDKQIRVVDPRANAVMKHFEAHDVIFSLHLFKFSEHQKLKILLDAWVGLFHYKRFFG